MNFEKSLNISAADILSLSLKKLYPDVELASSVLVEEGFYCDFITSSQISIHDLPKIEKQMKKIISSGSKIEKEFISKSKALELFSNQKYKLEVIKSLDENKKITIYKIGDFIDIFEDELVNNVNEIKAFKLLSIGGSYWNGDANNDQLIRIYGVAFRSEKELNEYLELLEERKNRDHRKIGKDLKLFTFNALAGQGLPIWLPNGTLIKNEIQKYINYLQFKYDFSPVITPVLGSIDLYKTSGHWFHYKENMFPPMQIDNEELVLRPMTCPHHILVYKNDLHSYKQLPIRLCEHSILHRYESSGGLSGLERVRDMILEDTHIFCRKDQIKQEVKKCYEMIMESHKKLGLEIYRVDLSLADFNDAEKYHGNIEMWNAAEEQLESALKDCGIKYEKIKGEAAFYGPKIDFQVKTVLGRIITVSTIQLDFLLPEKFDLSFKNENNEDEKPIMIHLGLIGTYERFLAIILEQTKGHLPFWLAPTQITIIPVNEQVHLSYCETLRNLLKEQGFRVYLDDRNERISKKIREAQISKVPYQIVIGDNEIKQKFKKISYREYGSENAVQIPLKKFIQKLEKESFNK